MPTKPSHEASPPDWDRVEAEIICPLCEYNLRGLAEPRCPECGYAFVWDEMLHPTRRLHPYLFEHHPVRRLWSLRRTLVGGLYARRFWRSLDPRQPSYPGRLLLYWFLVVGLYLLAVGAPIAGLVALHARSIIASNQALQPPMKANLKQMTKTNPKDYKQIIYVYGSVEAYLDERVPVRMNARLLERLLGDVIQYFAQNVQVLIFLLLPLVWPWLVSPGFVLLVGLMRRPELEVIHVRRCLLLSFDALPWLGLVFVAMTFASLAQSRLDVVASSNQMAWLTPLAVIAYLVFSIYRLGTAFRLYLQLEHGFTVVWVVHAVVLLFLGNVILLVGWMVDAF